MVELGQPPVNEPQSPVLVVDHDVVRLHVPVHDAHAVTVVQGTQQLVQIEPETLAIFKIKSYNLKLRKKLKILIVVYQLNGYGFNQVSAPLLLADNLAFD